MLNRPSARRELTHPSLLLGSVVSPPSQQVALFFKSRARVEEAYARSLTEMSRDLTDNYHKGDGKAGSVHPFDLIVLGPRLCPS